MNRGAAAEQQAEKYLQQQGLKSLARNYRSRFGEIDLIMQEGVILVFIEVRMRQREDYGGAAASIDSRKQRRIICTARQYLTRLAVIPPCRFDAVLLNNQGLNWLKNAFSA